jgi:hypothetical protein
VQPAPLSNKIIQDTIRGTGKRHFPLFDGHGLHLIERAGRYHWRLKYTRPDGRENRLALGAYPEVTLAEARELTLDARAKLRKDVDPAQERRVAKATARAAATGTFEQVAKRWLEVKTPGWSPITLRKNKRAVNVYLLPRLGGLDVAAVKTSDVLPVIQDAFSRSHEYANIAAGAAQGIIRLAIGEGAREEGRLLDLDLRHNLPNRKRGHNPAAITPAALTNVTRAILGLPNPFNCFQKGRVGGRSRVCLTTPCGLGAVVLACWRKSRFWPDFAWQRIDTRFDARAHCRCRAAGGPWRVKAVG